MGGEMVFVVMSTIDEEVESVHRTKLGAIERIKKLLTEEGVDPTDYYYDKKAVED